MKMFEQIGEFKPDSLIASHEFPILKEGIGLKAGQGVLKRGSLIIKSEKTGYIAGTADVQGAVFGILTDDFDTDSGEPADNIPATVYQTGVFNREAVITAGEGTELETYEDDMRKAGIYLRNVQKYE